MKKLKDKLDMTPPKALRENVFAKLEAEKKTSPLFLGGMTTSFIAILLVVFLQWQKQSMPLLEEGVAEVIEMQVVLESQELFAEFDAQELDDEEWEILTGGQI
ncbi:MAG: hypothetical protein Fur0010_16610 [Bdellovibrio sp.]